MNCMFELKDRQQCSREQHILKKLTLYQFNVYSENETLSRNVKGYNLRFIQTKALCLLRTRVIEKWQRVRKADQNVK